MHIQFYSPCKSFFTEVAREWFLPRVDPYVGFHISLCEECLAADLANKRFNSAVHHLQVFGEAETVDKPFPALLADMDPTIAMHPAMPFKTFGVWEALPTECAREGSVTCMATDMALQGSTATEDTTTFPTLVLEQAPTND